MTASVPMPLGNAAPDRDGPLPRFAVAFYGTSGVREACLTLQERLGLDVNLMLVALFACLERGVSLDRDGVAAVDGTTAAWHREIVKALRQVRTRLKQGPEPAPNRETDALRQEVKAAELRAERLQLATMAAWLDARSLPPSPGADPEPVIAAVARHAGGEGWNRTGDAESAAALAALLHAARDWTGAPRP